MISVLHHSGMALPLLAVCFLLLPIKPQSKQKYEEKAKAHCCSVVAQIESDSLTCNMAPVMWLGQRGTLCLNSHIPKERASRPTPNTLLLLQIKGGGASCLLVWFLLLCFMLWNELRWCRCWIITPGGELQTHVGGWERVFFGFKRHWCQEQGIWVGESTEWYGLDQPLSEAELAQNLLSIYLM